MPIPGGNPGNIQAVLGNWPGENDINPDPANTVGASAMHQGGNRMPLALPPQPQSWGLQNPTLPSQLNTWLRNYYGGVGQLDPQMLDALVQQARAGFTWDAAHAALGHGNDGLPDGGANLPSDGTLAGMGSGPRRFGGTSAGGITADLSEPQPTWLGTVNPSALAAGAGNPTTLSREQQDMWSQFRGPQGFQRPGFPDTGALAPLDYSGLPPEILAGMRDSMAEALKPGPASWGNLALRNGP
jgi:hypothetical protein